MTGRLAGKIALISGISGPQGRIAALAFAREGAVVHGCDNSSVGIDETLRITTEARLQIEADCVDLADYDATAVWIEAVTSRTDRIDILYCNAAFCEHGEIEHLSQKAWKHTIVGDLELVYNQCHLAWPHLRKSSAASVITVGSVSGMIGASNLGAASHAAGKGGVIALTRQLAVEGGPHNIRVNCISPGLILTPRTERVLFFDEKNDRFDEAKRESAKDMYALGRFGKPEEVVNCAIFLASDEASFITGQNIVVDGGLTIKR